ncbi:hypothetical protein ACJMK2_021249 [Sinanodonta woodiana]|uniref:Uncharacterized protein n=1 Tax=Sinanodonta woodiana TaxID=1069815 RepID=A0ABD3THZ6_SINWO
MSIHARKLYQHRVVGIFQQFFRCVSTKKVVNTNIKSYGSKDDPHSVEEASSKGAIRRKKSLYSETFPDNPECEKYSKYSPSSLTLEQLTDFGKKFLVTLVKNLNTKQSTCNKCYSKTKQKSEM